MKGQKIEKYGQKTQNLGQIPPIYLYREYVQRPTFNFKNFFTRQDIFIL